MGVQYAKETEDRGENKTKHNVINSIASLNTFVVQLMVGWVHSMSETGDKGKQQQQQQKAE